jgi:hypothetical protein
MPANASAATLSTGAFKVGDAAKKAEEPAAA